MSKASSCVPIYVHHDCKKSAIVEGDLEKIESLNDSIDLRDINLKYELDLRLVKYLKTAQFIFGANYIYVRIAVLQALEERVSGLRPYHRRSVDASLARLKEAGIIRTSGKPLPGNLGILLELIPAATTAKPTGSPVGPPQLHIVTEEDPQVPRSTPASPVLPAISLAVVCSTKAQVSTHMQKDQTSQGIRKREEEKRENARRSDIRTKGGKTTKKDNSEMRFGRILTDRTSKRQKNRALNKLLSFLYCEASNQLPGLQARWILARAIFENGWPQNPAHSGLEWEQLCKHFFEMTTAEKVSLINETILPLLMIKTSPAGVVVEAGIPVDQVDQVDNEKAAIEHLKKLVASGEVSEDEALVILQAQKDLIYRRSQG